MSTRAITPRFLLPLQGPLWRGVHVPLSQNVLVRFASTQPPPPPPPPEKHTVLEKPTKFNPPSHGSRYNKKYVMPKHVGPPLTRDELVQQGRKHYPGVMAPKGSWSHWFWHAQLLHTIITMGTLLLLGVFTFFLNYAYYSPFKELVPPISDLFRQPYAFCSAWWNVITLHEQHKSIKNQERRMDSLDDVAKRRYYMKMHGIKVKDPITVVFGPGEEVKTGEEMEARALGKELPPRPEEVEDGKKRKWLGIF